MKFLFFQHTFYLPVRYTYDSYNNCIANILVLKNKNYSFYPNCLLMRKNSQIKSKPFFF